MTNPNSSGGGMPKWLIILLVILLVMILGCCGGVTTCFFLARRAARTALPAFQQAQQEMIDAAQKAQQEAIQRQQAAQNGAAPAPSAAVPTDGGANATPAPAPTPAAPGMGALGTAKIPANFPKDIPILDGLTPSMSSSDNTNDSGMVMLSGKVKTDDAATYYTQSLPKAGYTQVTNSSINDTTSLVFTNDSLKVGVQVMPSDGGAGASSTVIITYQKK